MTAEEAKTPRLCFRVLERQCHCLRKSDDARNVLRAGTKSSRAEDELKRLAADVLGDPPSRLLQGNPGFVAEAMGADGFAQRSVRNGSMASRTRESSGVVALWSK
jgi:hypothetical protein